MPEGEHQTLLRSMVSNASFLSLSLLSLLDSDHPDTPPPPVLEPTLFWKSITLALRQRVYTWYDVSASHTLHIQFKFDSMWVALKLIWNWE